MALLKEGLKPPQLECNIQLVKAMQGVAGEEVDVSTAKVWGHFHQMSNAAAVADFCKHSCIFYATVAPGDVVYVPPGHVISECTMDGQNVYGLRAPVPHLEAVALVVLVWWCVGACSSASCVRLNRAFSCVVRGVACCLTLGA